MRYEKIKYFDVANGLGVRTSLFVTGCSRHCPGCFNPETWRFENGQAYTAKTEQDILKSAEPYYINGLSILGGEPLNRENRHEVALLVRTFRELYPAKTIWVFTGFCYEELIAEQDTDIQMVFENIDVLKDGPFIEAESEAGLIFKGSRNQRVLDMPETIKSGRPVILELE